MYSKLFRFDKSRNFESCDAATVVSWRISRGSIDTGRRIELGGR